MDHRKCVKLLKGFVIAAIMLILIGRLLSTASSTTMVGLGTVIAAVVLAITGAVLGYAYIRCPHCEGHLYYGRGVLKQKFCPHCGKPIEW